MSFRLNTDVTLKLQQKCPESSREFSRNRSFLRPSRKAFTTARDLSGRRSERICGAQTNQCYELGYSDCVS